MDVVQWGTLAALATFLFVSGYTLEDLKLTQG